MKVSLRNPKLEGSLTKTKLQKHLTDHMKANGMHPKVLRHLRASGFFSDLWSGIKSGVSTVVNTVKPLVKPALGAIAGYQKGGVPAALLGALGSGKPKAKATKSKSAHLAKMKTRGKLISKLMKERGISLPEASRLLKSQGK